MTYQPVRCRYRADNFGITCVRAHPGEPQRWCQECRNRRDPPDPRLEYHKVTEVLDRMVRMGDLSTREADSMLAEVARLRT